MRATLFLILIAAAPVAAAQDIGPPPTPKLRGVVRQEPPRLRVARVFNIPLAEATRVHPDSLRLVGSGVWVHDTDVGFGAVTGSGDEVSVRYVGMLTDGTIFDASPDVSITFTLGEGRVIQGWDEGLVGMRVGGVRALVIPPHLAYGSRGAGKIPPNAPLVFHVVLVGRR